MRTTFKQFLASGNVFIWGCAAGVSVSLLMVFGLLLLIMINGLGYFWISNIVRNNGWDGFKSTIGYFFGSTTRPISSTH